MDIYNNKELLHQLDNIIENLPEEGELYEQGVEDGIMQERRAFWSALLQDGNRTNWNITGGVFQGALWDFNSFYPTLDIKPVGVAQRLFYNWSGDATHSGSLKQRFEDCGVVLDTSQATSLSSLFNYCTGLTEVPTIDLRNAPTSTHIFAYCYQTLKLIEKIIVNENTTYASWFLYARGLEEIRVEGTIGQNSFEIQWSEKLSKESIISIINALSTTTTSLTVTLSLTAVKKAFETSSGANDGNTSPEWTALTSTKTNWTISLVAT